MKSFIFLPLLLFVSCASSEPDSVIRKKIKKYNLAAKWINGSSTMTIYCNGSFNLDDAMTFSNISGAGKSSGGFVSRISEKEFITGPLFPIEYKINKLPFKETEVWYFRVDDRTWKTTKISMCD